MPPRAIGTAASGSLAPRGCSTATCHGAPSACGPRTWMSPPSVTSACTPPRSCRTGAARSRVDSRHDAARAVARELLLDAPHFADRRVGCAFERRCGVAFERELARRGHAVELEPEHQNLCV